MGQSPDSSSYNTDCEGLPFYQGNADFGETHPMPRTWCSEPKKVAEPGDILISVRAPVGDINVADERCCIGRGLAAVRSNGAGISNAFLALILQSKRAYLDSMSTGSTFKAIGKKVLSSCEMPLYSREVQSRIACQVNWIDDCLRSSRRQLSALDDLVKSQFAEMFGDVRANPYGFEKCCLKDVARDKLSYGSSCSSVPYDGETRYLRITDIADDGRLNSDVRSPSHMSEKYLLNDGDLLFARSGATVGKTYRYKKGDGRAIYAGYLIRLVPDTDIVLPDYLFWYTKTDFYSSFVSNAQRAVAQPNINAQEYGSLELLVPPLDEQRRFVSFVARVDKLGFRRPISIGAYVSDSQGRLINLAVSRVAYRRKVIVNEEISSPIRTSR